MENHTLIAVCRYIHFDFIDNGCAKFENADLGYTKYLMLK